MTEEVDMRIMLCYDGSSAAKEGIYEAIKLARALNGEVLIVSCASRVDRDYPKIMEPIEQGLKEAKMVIEENKVSCERVLLFRADEDGAGDALVSFAREKQVDYMIIGIRSRSKVGKLLFGSVAQFVILRAECPVVGVKGRM